MRGAEAERRAPGRARWRPRACSVPRACDRAARSRPLSATPLAAPRPDPAPRLLDLGFGEKILAILALLDERRRESVDCQRVLVSATLPASVLDLARQALREPEYVRVGGADAEGGEGEGGGEDEELEVVPAGLERARRPAGAPAGGAGGAEGSEEEADEGEGDSAGEGEDEGDEAADSLVGLAGAGRKAAPRGGSLPLGADVSAADERLTAPAQLRQHFVLVPAKLRLVMLTTLLSSSLRHAETVGAKVLVFVSTGLQVEFLAELWRREADARAARGEGAPRGGAGESGGGGGEGAAPGAPSGGGGLSRGGVYGLHGSMAQSERTAVWRGFCAARSGVLVATDVAARGLNLEGVAQIVQFDLPADPMEYVHRIGRTARIGKAGSALLFVLPSEAGFLELLKQRGLELSEVRYESIQAALGGVGRVGKSADERHRIFEAEVALQHRLERIVASDRELSELAGRAFQSFLCAYAAHPKATKQVLRLRDLHVGHVAKAFALKEPPAQFSFAAQQKKAAKFKAKGRSKGVAVGRRARFDSDVLRPSLRADTPSRLTPAQRLEQRRSKGLAGRAKGRSEMPGAGVGRPLDRRMPG